VRLLLVIGQPSNDGPLGAKGWASRSGSRQGDFEYFCSILLALARQAER
jgi:hypothetical protein